ncbi:MAG: Rpp14/Pop5 family protein [archaeon]
MKENKSRYIVFQIIKEEGVDFEPKEIVQSVQKTLLENLGVFGYAEANIKIFGYDNSKKYGILKCNSTHVHKVRAALSFLSNVNNKNSGIIILNVSGTLKKARGGIDVSCRSICV